MHESNPYLAPNSTLETKQHSPVGGSLEGALAGDFSWSIGEVIQEAWRLQNGAKLPIWGAVILYYLAIFAVSFLFGMIGSVLPDVFISVAVSQVAIGLVTWPMCAGLAMIGIHRAAGLPVRATMVFDYYPKTLPIFVLYLVVAVAIVAGFMLLIVPGIYLMIALSLALPLLIEKNLSIGAALTTSLKVVNKCWFRVFGLFFIMTLLIGVSMIPFGIGLIWTLPMMMLTYGIIYRDMFGVNADASESENAQSEAKH